jgi:hypothetical protein
VADVVFKLTILETPIAGAPLVFNTQTQITDANGEVAAELDVTQSYTVSSGIEAISFTPLYGTGANFAAQGPILIEAARLLSSAEQPCRIVIGGTPNIYFSCVNQTDHALTVPLEYSGVNSIYSVTGQAVPPENFAPGTTGFSVPESNFTQGESLEGVWKFLGQEIPIGSSPLACIDRGVPGACELIDPSVFRIPFEYTREIILKLTRQSIEAARSGKWKVSGGKFTLRFLSRGAAALAKMGDMFKGDATGQNFSCQVTPLSCQTKAIPKKLLVRTFSQIFEGKLPSGLRHITANAKKEISAFERALKKMPNRYTTCK